MRIYKNTSYFYTHFVQYPVNVTYRWNGRDTNNYLTQTAQKLQKNLK